MNKYQRPEGGEGQGSTFFFQERNFGNRSTLFQGGWISHYPSWAQAWQPCAQGHNNNSYSFLGHTRTRRTMQLARARERLPGDPSELGQNSYKNKCKKERMSRQQGPAQAPIT